MNASPGGNAVWELGKRRKVPFKVTNNSNNDLCNLLPRINLPFYACELTFLLLRLSLLSLSKHLCKTCLSMKLYISGFILVLQAGGVQEPLFFMQSTLAEHSQLHTRAISIRLPRHVSDFRLRKHAWKIQILHILNMHQHFGIVRLLEVLKTQYWGWGGGEECMEFSFGKYNSFFPTISLFFWIS